MANRQDYSRQDRGSRYRSQDDDNRYGNHPQNDDGDFGQGDYGASSRGANSGQDRYGRQGGSRDPGSSGYRAPDYGGNRESGRGGYGGNFGSGDFSSSRDYYTGGTYAGSSADQRSNFGSNRDFDQGDDRYGYGSNSDSGNRGWMEPSGEGQQYGSRRGFNQGSGSSSGSESSYGSPSRYRQYSNRQYGGGTQSPGSQWGQDSQGGQGQHRGKGPKGYTRSDDRVKEMISERLREDPEIDASEITITVSSGKVTLDGTVDSRRTKNSAEDIAEQCGCDEVQNNLRVQKESMSPGKYGTSTTMTGATGSGAGPGETDATKRKNN